MAKNKEVRRRFQEKSDTSPNSADVEKRRFGSSSASSKSSAIIVGVVLVSVAAFSVCYFAYQMRMRERIRVRLDAPNMVQDNLTSLYQEPSKFWGTYRSQLYFGMKARTPHSPVFGMMWFPQLTNENPPPIRHWCDQGDHIEKYGWLAHNGVNFGIQEIEEKHYTIRTEFVKRPGQLWKDWTARFSIKPKDPNRANVVSLMFYMASDGHEKLKPIFSKNRLSGISGATDEVGNFEMQFVKSKATQQKNNFLITYAPSLDKLKEVIISSMKVDAWDKGRTMPFFVLGGKLIPRDSPGSNFIAVQVTVTLPYETEVIFESGSTQPRLSTLTGKEFTSLLGEYKEEFDKRFARVFKLEEKGYKENEINFAKAALSNMLGGIGYFHGQSIVKSPYNEEPIEYWTAPLYTAVPSRSFFPRGFLWDEGFHNLLISEWDSDISRDIISHWLDLLNADGWIPREQILGLEARAKVPAEFVVQKNENANPPTLFLPIQKLIKNLLNSNKPRDREFLRNIYPRLKVWFSWYNTTQIGTKPFTYRWRGRDSSNTKQQNPLTLTSGLDDYPRASHPSDIEYHLDLRCWIALASEVMADIARSLGEDWKEYMSTHVMLSNNKLLEELHWSDKKQRFSDYGLHTDRIKLERPKQPNLKPGEHPPQVKPDKIRVVLEEPTHRLIDTTFGYVSLFPFLLRLIEPDSPKLFKVITDLKDPNLLWTEYGLRSLAKSSPLYNRYNTEHDPPYWRGAIWINMNYLAISALNYYAETTGPYQDTAKDVYTELRHNIVKNIRKEYERTGYIWENYYDKTGEGKGSHPFTGWSALTVLIMAEKY